MSHLRSQRFVRVLGTGCLAMLLLLPTLLPAPRAAAAPNVAFMASKGKPCVIKQGVSFAGAYC